MCMKPRIKKPYIRGVLPLDSWLCYDVAYTACGDSPQEAYDNWKKKSDNDRDFLKNILIFGCRILLEPL